MQYILVIVGVLITLFSCALMTLDNAPKDIMLWLFIGIGVLLVGAIVANRAKNKATS